MVERWRLKSCSPAGDDGKVKQGFPFALHHDGGERLVIGETTMLVRVTGEVTEGAYTLFDMVPPLADTPPHVHEREDELYFVLEGEHVFTVGDEEFHVGPGAVVFGPRGIPHAHRRLMPGAGRLLALTSPAGYEGFVRELAEAHDAGALGPDELAAVSQRYGITWL
jgi:mannose-6-phosphate isomerase-like protein (cupin superfamily)